MKTSLHKMFLVGMFGTFCFVEANAVRRASKVMDKRPVIDSIVKPEKNLVIERCW